MTWRTAGFVLEVDNIDMLQALNSWPPLPCVESLLHDEVVLTAKKAFVDCREMFFTTSKICFRALHLLV